MPLISISFQHSYFSRQQQDHISSIYRELSCPTVCQSFIQVPIHWVERSWCCPVLDENADGSISDSHVSRVADEETAKGGNTLLLVSEIGTEGDEDRPALMCVRLDAEHVNTETVAVSVALKDVQELLSSVDGDGVYRGGRRDRDGIQLPKKREKAPQKQLWECSWG